MKNHSLYRWLRRNKFLLSKDDTTKPTHLCLDGGKFIIPKEYHEDFIEKYIDGVADGEKYYICEIPTEVSRMYCDLDIIDEREYTKDDILLLVKNISKVIDKYFGEFELIVCLSKSKKVFKIVNDDKKELIKTGIHIIWPELFIKQENALKLVRQFKEQLRSSLGPRPEYNSWDDLIDEGVYNSKCPSLRMVGSGKISKKGVKKSKDDPGRVGYFDEGRIYYPVYAIKSTKIVTIKKGKFKYMKRCILRVYQPESQLLIELPNIFTESKPEKLKLKGTYTNVDDPIFKMVEKFVRTETIEEWNLPLTHLTKHNTFYSAKIQGGLYCLNIEREHNSCGIYFQITSEGLYQRCFCKCNTTEGRKYGLCSKFKSKVFPLSYELRSTLFPNRRKPKGITKKVLEPMEIFPSYRLLHKDKRKYLKSCYNSLSYMKQIIDK